MHMYKHIQYNTHNISLTSHIILYICRFHRIADQQQERCYNHISSSESDSKSTPAKSVATPLVTYINHVSTQHT